ncbi:hypothetical protein F5884DRAFT_703760, partial [Xylogone sp. PMI_703]
MAPEAYMQQIDAEGSSDARLWNTAADGLVPLCRILTPIGMLGYGFDEDLNYSCLQDITKENVPVAIILDSGSTDSGPEKLALSTTTTPLSSYKRDLKKLLALSHEFSVPVLISSAGGSGTDSHVNDFLELIQEICSEDGNEEYKFKTLAIYSNISKSKVLKSLKADEVSGCGSSVPPLSEAEIHNATEVVAQMGPEPFLDAMAAEPDFDIIIGGRSYDPSPYIAYCVHLANSKQFIPLAKLKSEALGGFAFMGKIMECGALCSTPKSHSALATIYRDGTFDVAPLSPDSRCLPLSVAAHSLYEKTRPDLLPGPGGYLDLNKSKYEQLADGRSVRVTGAEFHLSRVEGAPYTVKLEAAKIVGYRTMIMGGIRDPILISQIDLLLEKAKEHVKFQHKEITEEWQLDFHVYGANGIMGALEPGDPSYKPREIFLVGEALAPSQKLSNSLASAARIAIVHGPYPGQRGTSGNLAMGVGGHLSIEMGCCTEFCIYHLIEVREGEEGARELGDDENSATSTPLFSWKRVDIGRGAQRNRAILASTLQNRRVVPTNRSKTPRILPTKLNYTNPQILCDIAPVIRSKNSGPYDITLDVFFTHKVVYELIKGSDLLSKAVIAKLYNLEEDEIIYCGFYDPAQAFKATIPRKRGDRKVAGGGFMETDIHGSQQYVGLLELKLSE